MIAMQLRLFFLPPERNEKRHMERRKNGKFKTCVIRHIMIDAEHARMVFSPVRREAEGKGRESEGKVHAQANRPEEIAPACRREE